MQPKDIALAPIYLYQGRKLKRTALRLPEAKGVRKGEINLSNEDCSNTFNFMLVGDSSAAGVGVESQQEALIGHLLEFLQNDSKIKDTFKSIYWELHATSGHTSYDALRRLYVLKNPETKFDAMIVMVGVNDTTTNTPTTIWQNQLREIIKLSHRKFGAKHILFPCLPPMQNMPAIPKPLNRFLGAKTAVMNEKLMEVCQEYDNVLALPLELKNTGLESDKLFAKDGFHPNSIAYYYLAKKIAKNLVELI